jgi:aryl-alcohol dehydrogenase-like predicted oxidoreductase
MKMRKIGQSGLETSALGLGCMAMSEFYGAFDEVENLTTLERAMEIGLSMLDTADLYGDGSNEELLGRFLAKTKYKPLIASKCGIVRTTEMMSDGNFKRERCGTPEYIRSSCDKSLQRLGVDVIDLYYLHRVDPNVPVEDSMGALADLKAAGKIRAIGLSEPSVDELRRANTVVPVDAVQFHRSGAGCCAKLVRHQNWMLMIFAAPCHGFLKIILMPTPRFLTCWTPRQMVPA